MTALTLATKNEALSDQGRIEKAMNGLRPALFRFIRSRVRTEEEAEDLLQDVLYQMLTSFNVTEPVEKLTSWLYIVARNKIIDWSRKKWPTSFSRQSARSFDGGEEESFGVEDMFFDPADSPDQVYARSLIWEELRSALDELPDAQREAFVRHELEGWSFNEMAEATGEPIKTLRSRKHYAVLFLRERLRDLYTEFETR